MASHAVSLVNTIMTVKDPVPKIDIDLSLELQDLILMAISGNQCNGSRVVRVLPTSGLFAMGNTMCA